MLDSHPILLAHTESNFPDRGIDILNETAHFRGVLTANGKDEYVFIHLIRNSQGVWRIDQLSFPDRWE
jgi:hypothetical protein